MWKRIDPVFTTLLVIRCSAKHSQLAAGRQPRGNKVPLVADFQPFSLLRNLLTFLAVPWASLQPQFNQLRKHSRFLCGCFADSGMGVAEEFLQNVDVIWP